MKIRLVVATRCSENAFLSDTATGRSINVGAPPFLELCLFPNNKEGLPAVYNRAIKDAKNNPATLVFAHDDLLFLDYFWWNRIMEGLSNFNIIGLAGNQRRVPNQPGWAFVDNKPTWDERQYLSGAIAHGKEFPSQHINFFGAPRRQVKLLDGLLLATNSETLVKNNLLFDERFDFHFYDMDFCRQAETKNLTCGTWDIAMMHESKGAFGSERWTQGYQKYLEKWGD